MGIIVFPHGIQGKTLSRSELRRYFDAPSIDALLLDLRYYRRRGYLDYEVSISPDYYEWERARYKFQFSADVMEPYDPFGVFKRSPYGIYSKPDTPLSDQEVVEVVTKLPGDMADKYLRFKLLDINLAGIRRLMAAGNATDHRDFEATEYNGLTLFAAEVSFHGAKIPMSYQQREILRTFMDHPESLLAPDDFTDNPEIFNPAKEYNDVYKTLSKAISDLHGKLRVVIGKQCIFNTPKEGWRLRI